MKVRIRRKFWELVYEELPDDEWGSCDPPEFKGKKVKISTKVPKGETELDTIIHEVMHACYFDLAEEAVDESASDLARILWRLGYRKVELDESD